MQTALHCAPADAIDPLQGIAPGRGESGLIQRRTPLVSGDRQGDDAVNGIRATDLDLLTRRILTEGGGSRIALDANGLNSYGCRPQPDPDLVALGSSTASVVSGPGFDAALALHARLLRDPPCHASEVERVRRRIAALSGARQVGGTEVILAASGTDILLIARQLVESPRGRPVIAVMAEAAETGSGVPAALAGRHFAADTCSGQAVDKGAIVITGASHTPVCVPLRRTDGTLRPIEEVDAEFTYRVDEIVRNGGQCLLVLTDVSKTGLVAPSPSCARTLSRRHPQALEVLVDACQFRLSPASVASYLQDDFMVALTGSKFVTGPTFCGALLLPPGIGRRARRIPLGALLPYSTLADWPATWRGAQELPDGHNTGLLLRWEAALLELAAFAALPDGFSETFLTRWGEAVTARIADDAGLEALPVASLQEHRTIAAWDGLQTIFPFLVTDPRVSAVARYKGRDATLSLHRQLQGLGVANPSDHSYQVPNGAQRFQLGQPVACGERAGVPVSALRVCASARSIVEASRTAGGISHAIDATMCAFDRLATLSGELR